MRHGAIDAADIVKYVTDGLEQPILKQWYRADKTRINAMGLPSFLKEIQNQVLDFDWDVKLLDSIQLSQQGKRPFWDWAISLQDSNATLSNAGSTHALPEAGLRQHIISHMSTRLRDSIRSEPPLANSLSVWMKEVKAREEKLVKDEDEVRRIVSEQRAERTHRKAAATPALLSRISNLPLAQRLTSAPSAGTGYTVASVPKLTEAERALLSTHEGCFNCRTFYAGHYSDSCPMRSLPPPNNRVNPATYRPLTLDMALAAKPATVKKETSGAVYTTQIEDVDDSSDDSCVPFTVPHLIPHMTITGPAIRDFPIPIKPLIDHGCPSTVIDDQLVTQLGLRRFQLPLQEDNLASLSGHGLGSREYVKLQVSSKDGSWTSGVHRAKVLHNCTIPLILGLPFLLQEKIVVDAELRTAIDKRTGFDLLNPPLYPPREWASDKPAPPPPPVIKKPPKPKRDFTVPLAHTLLPAAVMLQVRDRMETLAFEAHLKQKDAEMKARYTDLFTHRLPDVGDIPDHIYHRIRLKDPTKVNNGRGYAAAKKNQAAWKALLDDHLAAGRLRPSSSEYASPSFCVPKYRNGVPDHTVPPRMVNDYRELNKNTVRDRYPLPRVDDILADCGKGKLWAKLDMTNSFSQTRVHPDDIHLTAIRTPWGLYEWVVMPQGGCNAPATHQRRMTDALRHLIGEICHVYLDDIIIWSDSLEEHTRNVELVLDALREAGLICNPTKSDLFLTRVEFLGHVISREGIAADPRKVDRIMSWPTPKTATDVRSFLGLVRYIAVFLPALAEHTAVLTPLTAKEYNKALPTWTPAHRIAFDAIKKLVLSRECLTVIDYEDTTKQIFVTTDASDRRTGAVLSFGETWETARPVAYESYQLNSAERNYPTHEKELLAIVKALKKWRSSLLNVTFQVMTDHRTLEYFSSQLDMSRRQARWAMHFAQFDFEIHYVKGEDNTVADALSRLPDELPTIPEPVVIAACLARSGTGEDPVQSRREHLTAASTSIVITADTELLESIKKGYTEDDFCQQLLTNLSSTEGAMFDVATGLLYVGRRLVIPRVLKVRELLYSLAHDVLGHFGFDKSYAALRGSYYWPNMRRDLEEAYIPSCTDCQRNKSRTSKTPGPLHPLPVPDNRFDVVGLDFVGPLPVENGKDTIVTFTDLLGGADIRMAAITSTITAEEFAVVLFDEWYCENGLMLQLVSDRDKLFISKVWAALHKLTGVKLKMSTAYHPETDGGSERTNKTVNQALRYYVDRQQKGWLAALPRTRFAIMNTVNASTGYSGFQLKTGRSPRIIPPLAPLPANATPEESTAQAIIARITTDVQDAQDNLLAAKIRQAFHANKHRAPEIAYAVGDQVMLSTKNRRNEYKRAGKKRTAKFMPRNDGPYTVVKAFPEKSEYTLQLPGHRRTFPGFHASLLKPYHPNDPALFPERELPKPGPVVTEDGIEEWSVEKIIDSKRAGRGMRYLVRWAGYGVEHDSWEPGSALKDSIALDAWEAGQQQ